MKSHQAILAGSLWSAVGKLYDGTGAGCTAIAVEPDQVLTAAHCAFNRRTGFFLQPSSLHFLLGLDGDDYRAHALVESYGIGPQKLPQRRREPSDQNARRARQSQQPVEGSSHSRTDLYSRKSPPIRHMSEGPDANRMDPNRLFLGYVADSSPMQVVFCALPLGE